MRKSNVIATTFILIVIIGVIIVVIKIAPLLKLLWQMIVK